MIKYAPIALFVYNRKWHTETTINALQKNKLAIKSDIIIFSDGAKTIKDVTIVNEIRNYVSGIDGFNKVTLIKRDKNLGLADNIIDGVTKVVNEYGKIIVLEDDLVTSPYFLDFMNDSLELYKDEHKVASIHGYIYPINDLPNSFFIRGADCWGWATWKRAWDLFETDGKILLKVLKLKKLYREANFNNSYRYTQMLKDQIKGINDSWAIRWYFSTFLNNMMTLYPGTSLVQNIGNDNSGTNCKETDKYLVNMNNDYKCIKKIKISEDVEARRKFENFFSSLREPFIKRIINKTLKLWKC